MKDFKNKENFLKKILNIYFNVYPRWKKKLDRLEFNTIQNKIIDEFVDIVSHEINLSKTIIKGFYWKSIREWQKIHGKTLAETESGQGSTFEERKEQAIQISDIFRKKITGSTCVIDSDLELGIKKAIDNYLATYAKR